MIQKFIRLIHKVLGLLLSLLFLMWFLSGFVMIYHSFPRASQSYVLQRQQPLPPCLPAVDTLLSQWPDTLALQSLSVEMRFDRPVANLRGRGLSSSYYLDNLEAVGPFDEQTRQQTLQLWCDAPVSRIDTLHRVDQWIPFGYLEKEMPIYKYYFDDAEEHQLYMTSRDGRVLQFTDSNSRFWAWLGAIPHWVYFTSLRQNQTLWIEFVKWAAGIGCIMCLAGWILGIRNWWKQRRRGFWHSPYKKRWYKWHFVCGIFFGLFAITFAFSGLMSLTDLPDWMKKAPKEKQERRTPPQRGRRGGEILPVDAYKLDYRQLVTTYDSIKSISWSSWQQQPYYKVTFAHTSRNIDASVSNEIRTFRLTEEMVRQDVARQFPDSISWSIELLTEPDNDYYDRKQDRSPLPVYRVTADDYMHTRIYYQPETLSQRRFDDDSRTRRFLYSGLHSLNIKFLADHPVLWNIVMFTLLIGGTFLSLTGVVLTLRWLRRQARKLNGRKN